MSRRIQVFNSEGNFSHYLKRSDAADLARAERADWHPTDRHQLMLRPAILTPSGKLNIWVQAHCPAVPREIGGPSFKIMQLV